MRGILIVNIGDPVRSAAIVRHRIGAGSRAVNKVESGPDQPMAQRWALAKEKSTEIGVASH